MQNSIHLPPRATHLDKKSDAKSPVETEFVPSPGISNLVASTAFGAPLSFLHRVVLPKYGAVFTP